MTKKKKRGASVPAKPRALPTPASFDTTIQQVGRHWCWAACIEVALKSRGQNYSQSALANKVPLAKKCTEGAPPPDGCDVGLTDEEIAKLFKDLKMNVTSKGPLTETSLNTELERGPVAISFTWGHMCLIYGRERDNGKYLMYDPLGPASGVLALADIRNYGKGDNTWQASWTGL